MGELPLNRLLTVIGWIDRETYFAWMRTLADIRAWPVTVDGPVAS